MAENEQDDEQWVDERGLEEQQVVNGGRRLGMQWAPWMGDWFTSLSPRNGNNNAEGPWNEWVNLALAILADPMTATVRPDVQVSAKGPDEDRRLSATELRARFDRRSS